MRFFFFLILSNTPLVAQIPLAGFNAPASACQNENITLVNTSTNANFYEWDFCDTDLLTTPSVADRGAITGSSASLDIRLAKDGNNWFGFVADAGGNKLVRLSFGNSLSNNPTFTNINGFLTAAGVDVVQVNNEWFGIVSIFNFPSKIILLKFGNSLANTPTTEEIILPANTLLSPRTIRFTYHNNNYFVMAANANQNAITVIKLGAGIQGSSATFKQINTTNVWTGLDPVFDGSNFYLIAATHGNPKPFLLNFGNDWFNDPIVQEMNTLAIAEPSMVQVEFEANAYHLLLVSKGGQLYRFNFGASLNNLNPTLELNFTLPSVSNVWGMDIVRDNGKYTGFVTSLGTNRYYQLTFDDPTCEVSPEISNQLNPDKIKYTTSGVKEIGLRISADYLQKNQIGKAINISADQAPTLTINALNRQCQNLENQFSVTSNQTLTNYQWNLGDNGTSNLSNFDYAYANPGLYAVTLEATSVNGCTNSATKDLQIFFSPDFNLPAVSLFCTNQSYTFTNTTNFSALATPTWQWQVNSVNQSTATNLEYPIASTNTLEIKLIASNQQCTNEITKSILSISSGNTAIFSHATICQNDGVLFNNQTNGIILNSSWDFGDGTLSTDFSPTKVFSSPGIYPVKLQVTNSVGCINSTTINVQVYSKPAVNFMAELPPFSCSGTPTQFKDLTPNPTDSNLQSWVWTFAPGQTSTTKNPTFTYQNPGLVPVTLSVTSNRGCSNSITKEITISASPSPQITSTPTCLNEAALFKANVGNATEWFWQIGTTFYFVAEPVHVFANTGNVNALVVVTANNGCVATAFKEVGIPVPMVTDFTATKTCAGLPAEFAATATLGADPIIRYEWNFEGDLVLGQNVTKTFASTGTKIITVNAIGESGCRYEASKAIQFVAPPVPMFTASPDRGRPPLSVQFTNTSQQATSYEWQFNDANNTTSTAVSPTFVFDQLGDYPVDLIARNDAGCEATRTIIIQVLIPRLSISIHNFDLIKNNDGTYNANVTLKNDGNLPAENVAVALKSDSGFRLIVPIGTVPMGDAQSFPLSASILPGEQTEYVCAEIVLPENEASGNLDACDLLSLPFTAPAPYPNPAQNKIIQDFIAEENSLNTSVSIHNAQGKEVYQNTIDTIIGLNRLEIDVQNWATGIYTIKITATGYQKSFKVAIIK
jgi:PKD repeat protein